MNNNFKKIIDSIGTYPIIIVEGNTFDLFETDVQGKTYFLDFERALARSFANSENPLTNDFDFISYDTVNGFNNAKIGDSKRTSEILDLANKALDIMKKESDRLSGSSQNNSTNSDRSLDIIRTVMTNNLEDDAKRVCFIIRYLDIINHGNENEIKTILTDICLNTINANIVKKCNSIVILSDNTSTLKLSANSSIRVKNINIPKPNLTTRKKYIEHIFSDEVSDDFKEELCTNTEFETLFFIKDVYSKYASAKDLNARQLVSYTKHGLKEDPWANLKKKMKNTSIKKFLSERVFDQKEATENVEKCLASAAFVKNANPKIRLIVMFVGESGSGKTEFAKSMAEYLYGSADRFIRIDLNQYQDSSAKSALIGSPPGYVGSDCDGFLIADIKKNPMGVILLEELEKAHPEVLTLLMTALDEGEISDAHGNRYSLHDFMIIATSNAGASMLTPDISEEEAQRIVREALKERFLPEVVNRLPQPIVFKRLSKETMKKILHKSIDENAGNYNVTLHQSALDYLYQKLDNQLIIEMNGRGAKAVAKELCDALNLYIVLNDISETNKIECSYNGDFIFNLI